MQPRLITLTGTGVATSPVALDYFQNPFSVSVAATVASSTATFGILWTYDFSSVFLVPTWNGATTVPTVWFTSSAFTAGSVAILTFSSPIAAISLQNYTANATSTVQAWIAQATKFPS